MMEIPDFFEQGEARAERDADARALPNGRWRCFCGREFDPDREGGTLSPDPYAPPVCGTCLDEARHTYELAEGPDMNEEGDK